MYRKMLYILVMVCVCSMMGCGKDKTEEVPDRKGAEVSGTDMPDKIGWQGGEYTIDVEYKLLTRSQPVEIMEPWSYRLSVDEDVIAENEVTDGSESVKVSVPQNLTEKDKSVKIEILSPEILGQTPVWKEVAHAAQQAGLVEIAGIYWAQGNLTVSEGKFAIATKPEDLGFLFKHYSTYGISSEGDHYSGVAYIPAETTVALADIPEKNGDPCQLIAGGDLRMPSFYEMNKLYNESFNSDIVESEGVYGQLFGGGKLFFPYSGVCEAESGVLHLKNQGAGYWHSGMNAFGSGGMLSFSKDDVMFFYNDGISLMSVRCVRNIREASYVSHSPEKLESNATFSVDITCDPGDMPGYKVALVDIEYDYEIKAFAEGSDPTVTINVPVNEELVDIVYEIYINDKPTGKRITHPKMSNYVFYKSHTPTGTVSADAFTLSVTCESDMDSFEVEIKSGTESIAKDTGSKDNLKVQLAIPANTGDERVLDIWVNGKNTGRKVTQEGVKKLISVVWSTGYLKVDDGAYIFAGEQEPGMYFKFKSRYGMTLDATGKKYSGTAYGPSAETKAYADVAYGDEDPCSLINDGKSWRMPTQADFQELLSFDYSWKKDAYRAYTDGEQTVYITPSGSFNDTGTSVAQPTWAKVWTTTLKDDTKYVMLSGSFSNQTSSFIVTAGAAQNTAMMVRCVRDK